MIDEVQRLPALLNEVHALLSERPAHYRFALSGSSARKLRRLDVNLLAGRAVNRQFFPLTAVEIGRGFDLERALRFGVLPQVQSEPADAVDILDAYVTNYIREEILQEALVRNLESFARFLEVAAIMNGQVVNVAGVARDAAVARPTVQGYFGTLVDTLVGSWLPAWRERAKVKEVASPKFYFFDPGVARALAGRVREPVEAAERGFLLETLVLHELRAAQAYRNLGGAPALLADAVRQRGRFRLDPRRPRGGCRSEGIESLEARPWRGAQVVDRGWPIDGRPRRLRRDCGVEGWPAARVAGPEVFRPTGSGRRPGVASGARLWCFHMARKKSRLYSSLPRRGRDHRHRQRPARCLPTGRRLAPRPVPASPASPVHGR